MSVNSSQLRFPTHTTYYQSFFLLRVPLMISGQLTHITSDDGHLTIGCRYPPLSITFDSLITEVDTVMKKYGLEGVSNYWCEDVPLFELKFSSQDCLKRLLHSEEKVRNELASRIATVLAQQQKSPNPVAVCAVTEVYMLTPRPDTKDAQINRVSPQNLATCITLWRESEMFNFEALFRAFRMDRNGIPNEGEVNLMLLSLELHEVTDWFSLGLYLNIPSVELQDIRCEPTLHCIKDRRREMLELRLKRLPKLSWSHVVKALMDIGRESLAHKVALKYGVPVPAPLEKKLPQLDTSSQISMPSRKKRNTHVQKLTKEVEAKDRELALHDQSLEEAKRQKDAIIQKLTKIRQTINQTQLKTIKLMREKMELEKQLQQLEKELQPREECLLINADHQMESEQLSNIIKNKEEQIKELQERLHTVESELVTEKKRSQDLKEKLQQATTELEKKSAVQQEQEKAYDNLKTHLEREREMVDFLRMQLTIPDTSKDKYTREVEHQLSTAKAQCESNEKEIGQHKLTISQREEKIKTLSHQLQTQEALIAQLECESAIIKDGNAKQQLELEEHILEVTNEAAELRDKLKEVEESKQEAVRDMETVQTENVLLQNWMIELREQEEAFNQPTPRIPSAQTRASNQAPGSTQTPPSSASHVVPSTATSSIYPTSISLKTSPTAVNSEHVGIVPQLQNVVSTVDLGCRLDLKKIALHARNAEYNPKSFAAVIMRIREPKTTALIYSSGKVVCTGAKSEELSRLAARKYARIVQKLGFNARFNNFKIRNIVCSCDVKFPIRLEGLVVAHSQFSRYEPELYPGLIYRMVKPKIVLLIFESGKVLLNGAKERSESVEAFTNIYPILKSFRKI